MKYIEEQLKNYKAATAIAPDEEELSSTVRRAKKAFYESAASRSESYFEFLHQQSRYIRKRWWVLQFLVLTALYWLLHTAGGEAVMQRHVGVLASVFVIMMVPELWKNRSGAAMEIEGAAYYSLRQIYAARMLLFAVVDGLLLSLFCGLAVCTTAVGVEEIVLQFFLPMIVTCCICFRILCSKFAHSEYIAVFLSMLFIAVWEQVILQDNIYNAISVPMWIGVCVLSLFYFVYVIHKVIKKCEDYWEVTTTWN